MPTAFRLEAEGKVTYAPVVLTAADHAISVWGTEIYSVFPARLKNFLRRGKCEGG